MIDDRIESIRAPATRKRIASLEGLVSQLIRRVDKLEMSSRLGGYQRKKNRNRFERIYDYEEDDEEDDNYGRSILMEQAEEYRKRDLSKKKKRRRRKKRVVEEEDTSEEEEEEETKKQKEEKEEISPIKKIQPKTIRFVESPYNVRHEKTDETSIYEFVQSNETESGGESRTMHCSLRNAGIII